MDSPRLRSDSLHYYSRFCFCCLRWILSFGYAGVRLTPYAYMIARDERIQSRCWKVQSLKHLGHASCGLTPRLPLAVLIAIPTIYP